MRAELRARLLDYDDLAGLIVDRMSWVAAPAAEARPYVVLQTIADEPRAISADGPGRVHWLHVQFDAVGDTYAEAAEVAAELMNALSTVVGYASTNWRFDRVYLLERGRDDYDPPQDASELGLFRRIIEADVVVTNKAGINDPDPPYFPPYTRTPDDYSPA